MAGEEGHACLPTRPSFTHPYTPALILPTGSTTLSTTVMMAALSSLEQIITKASAGSGTLGGNALVSISGLVDQGLLSHGTTCTTNAAGDAVDQVLQNLTALTSSTQVPGEKAVTYRARNLGKEGGGGSEAPTQRVTVDVRDMMRVEKARLGPRPRCSPCHPFMPCRSEHLN